MTTTSKQTKAWKELFSAIFEENGYFENLRQFAKDHGYSNQDMTEMLYESYMHNCPEGMGPYYFMDSMEEHYEDMKDSVENIYDMVDWLWDHQAWKE